MLCKRLTDVLTVREGSYVVGHGCRKSIGATFHPHEVPKTLQAAFKKTIIHFNTKSISSSM